MSAARHADVLFVKDRKDNGEQWRRLVFLDLDLCLPRFSMADLKTYCDNNNIKYTLFKDWTVVKAMVEKVSRRKVHETEAMF